MPADPTVPRSRTASLAASVIVTTYNRPDALRAVLEGLAAQTCRDFECIVADDGSGAETSAVVDAMSGRFPTGRLKHVWQEHVGFRAAAIRNRAIEASGGHWIICLDGDCVPRPRFIEGHLRAARASAITRGSRLLCSEVLTRETLAGGAGLHRLTDSELRELHAKCQINRIDAAAGGWRDAVRSLMGALRLEGWQSVRTCNMLAPREAIVAAGGFDERYTGWGYEDSDLVVRLMRRGLHIRRGLADTAVLHLWHPDNPRDNADRNRALLEDTLRGARQRSAVASS
jgi:glycosyltransferase involved in cell wall biosynthesis